MVCFFDAGVKIDGFWNYDQMDLQAGDIFNVLAVKFPEFDVLIYFGQSSGHVRMHKGSFNADTMSVRWGGRQGRLCKTKINKIGTYPGTITLDSGELQDITAQDQHLNCPCVEIETSQFSNQVESPSMNDS